MGAGGVCGWRAVGDADEPLAAADEYDGLRARDEVGGCASTVSDLGGTDGGAIETTPLFAEIPDLYSLLGAALIVASTQAS